MTNGTNGGRTMLKRLVQRSLRQVGYQLTAVPAVSQPKFLNGSQAVPPPVEPVWPLPRRKSGPSDAEIRQAFERFKWWHYAYAFEGGLSFPARHQHFSELAADAVRPLQRFRHFMPYLVQAAGGSLRGKRVLDIACNSGFWALQFALLGAEVVGFDAKDTPDAPLVSEAKYLKGVVGLDNLTYETLDFWEMTPERLGTFDIVLNLGIVYHLPKTEVVLERTKAMSRDLILVDSSTLAADGAILQLWVEEAIDIRAAAKTGIVSKPTRDAINMILSQLGVREWFEIPLRTRDMPADYLDGRRFSWLVKV